MLIKEKPNNKINFASASIQARPYTRRWKDPNTPSHNLFWQKPMFSPLLTFLRRFTLLNWMKTLPCNIPWARWSLLLQSDALWHSLRTGRIPVATTWVSGWTEWGNQHSRWHLRLWLWWYKGRSWYWSWPKSDSSTWEGQWTRSSTLREKNSIQVQLCIIYGAQTYQQRSSASSK